MATVTRSPSSFDRAVGQLRRHDLDALQVAQRDTLVELCGVLDQILRVLAGEVRIVATGVTAVMKSTVVELLLGRPDRLSVGLGAVTAAPTVLRLVQTDEQLPASSWVLTLAEDAALRRVRALLQVDDDDPRPLAELAKVPHSNQRLVADLAKAAAKFGYAARYDLVQFGRLGGSVLIDGFGAALVRQVVTEVPISVEEWDLSWADGRAVVVVDLPGTGVGRGLENRVRDEFVTLAHVALNVVGVSGGAPIVAPPVRAESNCVFVVTKLDRVENPRDAREIRHIENAVASSLLDWTDRGQRAKVAAVSGVWAAPDEATWRAFDPSNADVWEPAQRSRTAWQSAAFDPHGPTAGEFQAAVEAALQDGGVRRLRRLVAELASGDRAREVDRVELASLVRRALQLVDDAAAPTVSDRGETARDLVALLSKLDRDTTPVDALRGIAKKAAAEAVYGDPAWDVVSQQLYEPDGRLRVALSKVQDVLREMDLDAVAAAAFGAADDELATVLTKWTVAYGSSEKTPDDRPESSSAAVAPSVARFVHLADRLLDRLVQLHSQDSGVANGRRRPRPRVSEHLPFRPVARTRAELSSLLERMIVEQLDVRIEQARATAQDAVNDRMKRQAAQAASLAPTLRQLRRSLGALAPEPPDDGD